MEDASAMRTPHEYTTRASRPDRRGRLCQILDVEQAALGAIPGAPPLEGRLGPALAVMQLTHFQCRWPIGSVDSDKFHFCAKPTDPALNPQYCEAHRRLAFSRSRIANSA